MAQTPVVMPKMSMTMTEGEVVEILVNVGDKVEKGQVVAVVGTDKTDMEVESDHEGEVTEISSGPGDVIEVGAPLFVLETEGEDLLAGMFGDEPAAETVATEPVDEVVQAPVVTPVSPEATSILAMPGARKTAKEQGIDLSTITPASPAGVIKVTDLPAAGSREEAARHQVAKVVDTSTQIPQFSLTSTISLKTGLPADVGERFVVLARAWVRTLQARPRLNQRFSNGMFTNVDQIRIAALVKTPLGFVAPTLAADSISESSWAESAKAVLDLARHNKIAPENLQAASTSITDLGEFGIRQANTLLFQPQSSGFNVGQIRSAGENYEIDCTIVIDHRIADPGDGAEALAFFAAELQKELDVNG
jgi:pyruvate dehydrogenase E2 component (dihydrolipoamide acetyltransferase)